LNILNNKQNEIDQFYILIMTAVAWVFMIVMKRKECWRGIIAINEV